uniref:Peptide N-acetyl-beta-D-glucosaminyl asparaginase amidase A N-terminal domain-containing protein n=1 Tax=Aegilops tauschii TaxID=37682 RepID=N1QQX6_AEGTA
MSRGLPLNDGLWYKIQNATDVVSTSVTLPSNTYRAVVEVFVSFHGDDEFWWTNQPGADANGPFRETFHFDNTNTNDGETVNQTTVAHAGVAATDLAGVLYYSVQTRQSFPLLLDSGADQALQQPCQHHALNLLAEGFLEHHKIDTAKEKL